MKYDTFISTYEGKTVDTDGYYGGQCMDLMHRFIYDVIGNSNPQVLAASVAKDVYLRFPDITGASMFTKIPNTPTAVPQRGDIIFWGTGIGPAGHVAIVISADVNTFISFDQNWLNVQKCQKITHNYNAVLGWLRPHDQTNIIISPDAPMNPELQKKASIADRVIKAREGQNYDVGKMTDQQEKDFIARMLRERDRGGKFDQLGLKAGMVGDSNLWTVDQVYNKIKATGIDKKELVDRIKVFLDTL
jgi:hypothetical protein